MYKRKELFWQSKLWGSNRLAQLRMCISFKSLLENYYECTHTTVIIENSNQYDLKNFNAKLMIFATIKRTQKTKKSR